MKRHIIKLACNWLVKMTQPFFCSIIDDNFLLKGCYRKCGVMMLQYYIALQVTNLWLKILFHFLIKSFTIFLIVVQCYLKAEMIWPEPLTFWSIVQTHNHHSIPLQPCSLIKHWSSWNWLTMYAWQTWLDDRRAKFFIFDHSMFFFFQRAGTVCMVVSCLSYIKLQN